MTNPIYLPVVTLERVIAAMHSFDIELDPIAGRTDAATANLNNLPVLFAVMDSVVIVRCDIGTDAAFDTADAALFLAANQLNSVSLGARTVITAHEGLLVVRTERDIPCAAGLSDEQLAAALKLAVDGVLRAQDAMLAAAQEMTELGAAATESQPEA